MDIFNDSLGVVSGNALLNPTISSGDAMTRLMKEVDGELVTRDILCDVCGRSTKDKKGNFIKATLAANFLGGHHFGEKFGLDFCEDCFDELMVWVLIDKLGTCIYDDVRGIYTEDDIREWYAHLKSSGFFEIGVELEDDDTEDESDLTDE